MRTIRVTGKGQIRVRPDMTRITMTLTGLYKEYGETLRHSSADTEVLKDVLAEFGFERSDLKTLSFNVDTEYESYRDRNKTTSRSSSVIGLITFLKSSLNRIMIALGRSCLPLPIARSNLNSASAIQLRIPKRQRICCSAKL